MKSFLNHFHQKIQPFFAQSPFLARLYFAFLNSSYQREQFATLRGMQTYRKRIKSTREQSNPLLRRNIHRLEKGLIMRPLKPIFALDYIEETQQAYLLACQMPTYQVEELNWAQSVLTKYYNTVSVEQSSLLTYLSTQFAKITSSNTLSTNNKIPYKYNKLESSQISAELNNKLGNKSGNKSGNKLNHNLSYQEFSQFIKLRRSVRWFKQTSICRDKIKQAITLASQAPSACNRQPYEFYVIDQQPLLSQVSKLAIGGGGFSSNIPCLVVLVGDYSCYEHERDRHVIYIDASLAAMQFMQTLPTLGLASCPMNWPELSVVDKKINQLLKLPNHKKTIMLIAVGEPEPDGKIPYSQKKSAEQLVYFVDS